MTSHDIAVNVSFIDILLLHKSGELTTLEAAADIRHRIQGYSYEPKLSCDEKKPVQFDLTPIERELGTINVA